MKVIKGSVTSPKGFKASGIASGIKRSGKKDLALIVSSVPAKAAATFTCNKVKAAPVMVSMENIRSGKAQAIVANAGCANACTGAQGIADAKMMAEAVSSAMNIDKKLVLIASTGSIGSYLPMKNVLQGIRSASKRLSEHGGIDAAEAIMTTDKARKDIAVSVKAGGRTIKIGGIAKGSGMIAPNMATMFAFITTDASIPSGELKRYLRTAVDRTFNMTVVDKETSTNDCVFILANGQAGNRAFSGKDEKEFTTGLNYVCEYLAKAIARDGEGATKLIEVRVAGARSEKDARTAAKSIAGSDLVKSAVFGEDPNFGRIMAALGYSGAFIKQDLVNVFIGNVEVVRHGKTLFFDNVKARKHLKGKEVCITVMLGLGKSNAAAWGCDLTYEYVRINAEYHT